MKVFKFGGASVKDAESVKNVASILKQYDGEKIVVVISAMGKTTNALEEVAEAFFYGTEDPYRLLGKVKEFHANILKDLFPNEKTSVEDEVHNLFVELEWLLDDNKKVNFDYTYDQIVSTGELISTKIISGYLNSVGLINHWVDARDIIKTDNTYREARINWELTEKSTCYEFDHKLNNANKPCSLMITQGFIGVTSENYTTTLGREGSDFTAAIIAYCTNAQDVTIWKDVPGVLNADPKWFSNTQRLDHISYKEAVELAYFGATVIHPKTIKPLQNKNIPLYVKSFVNPKESGTRIDSEVDHDTLIPSFIFKMDQVLISISPKDYSFIVEHNLSQIFSALARHGVKVNLMQNSAINFSVSVNQDKLKVPALLRELQEDFHIRYNDGLELITIRHYDQATIDRVMVNKELLLEQRTRHTIRLVVKNIKEI